MLLYLNLNEISECEVGLFELLTISAEELKQQLEQTDVEWNIDIVFKLICSWRERNVSRSIKGCIRKTKFSLFIRRKTRLKTRYVETIRRRCTEVILNLRKYFVTVFRIYP